MPSRQSLRRSSENATLRSILHVAGQKRVYHEATSIQTYGEGKTPREFALVRLIEEHGNFNIKVAVLFIFCLWYMGSYGTRFDRLEVFEGKVRCQVPELEDLNFTFDEMVYLINAKTKPTYTDYKTVHYCEFDFRNYSELLEKGEYDYDKMLNIIKVNETTVESAKCSTLISQTTNGFSVYHEMKAYCHRGHLRYVFATLNVCGEIIGLICLGFLADIYGRQPIYIISVFCYILSLLALCISNEVVVMIGQFLHGIGGYVGFQILYIIFIENCSQKTRSSLGYIVFISKPFSWLVEYLQSSTYHSYTHTNASELPMIFMLLLSLCIIGESIRWLVISGNEPFIWQILEKGRFYRHIFKKKKKPKLKVHFGMLSKPIFRSRIVIASMVFLLLVVIQDSSDTVAANQYGTRGKSFKLIMICPSFVTVPGTYWIYHKKGLRLTLLLTNFVILFLDSAIYVQNVKWRITVMILALVQHSFCISVYILMFLFAVKLFPTSHRATSLSICHLCYSTSYLILLCIKGPLSSMNKSYSHLPSLCCAIIIIFLISLLPHLRAVDLPDKPIEALHGLVV